MQKYIVDYEDYYRNVELFSSRTGISYNFDNVKDTIGQLVEKYMLHNRNVLSIGPAFGCEEYWMYKNGCKLTLVDIDERGQIEPILKTLLPASKHDGLTYYIGDAYDYEKDYCECKFDLLYLAGFTPDELRKGQMVQQYNGTWPSKVKPYLDLVQHLAQKSLKQGGLFICQSWYGGFDQKESPHYLGMVRNQLARTGIVLLTRYSFKNWPGVSLTIGYKGSTKDVVEYWDQIKDNPEISGFHGRSELSKDGIAIDYQLF